MAKATRSLRLSAPLSPEILWYLESRGYEVPTCRPLIRTPEPRDVKGAIFDPERVDRVITAMGHLRHTKGKWAGQPIVPAAVQVAYIIAPVFGWVAPSDDDPSVYVRIIRDAYVEMPRKGAKTTLVSALAMYLGFADGEAGAEVLLGAASRDQAGQAFKPLAAVAKSSRVLLDAGVRALRHEIQRAADNSVVKPVSSRGDLAHGANVSGGLVDELHVHKSPDLLEAIESGTGARTQPLVFIITTADDGQVISVYAVRRDLIEKIAARVFKAPSMYGVVFAADEREDPFSEQTIRNANPLYPVTPSPAFMRAAMDKAKSSPVAMASYLRLHLGIRAKMDKRFIDLGRWDRNASIVDEAALAGRLAWGGIDLGSVSDITALAWLFPDVDRGGYDVLLRFWTPEASLEDLDKRTQRSASGWVKDGFLKLTPGDVTDYDFIAAQAHRDLDTFDVHNIGYDRWHASQLVIDLQNEDEDLMVAVGQGVASLSAPMKELERLVLKGTAAKPLFRHGGNPVLRWMADNLRVYSDPSGNIKPDKKKSMDKIDGFSAIATALAVAMAAEPERESVYDRRDALIL
ncbi:MAG TPA: terminase TerL endonuclease subunit [Jatrophihabitans sp.]|nr:terminase TerL endonuclease subunit [Jatrophihabitans sp.]